MSNNFSNPQHINSHNLNPHDDINSHDDTNSTTDSPGYVYPFADFEAGVTHLSTHESILIPKEIFEVVLPQVSTEAWVVLCVLLRHSPPLGLSAGHTDLLSTNTSRTFSQEEIWSATNLASAEEVTASLEELCQFQMLGQPLVLAQGTPPQRLYHLNLGFHCQLEP